MKIYRARTWGAVHVDVGGETRPLSPRLDLARLSETGFSWGYEGRGPRQLALALIADATGDDALALAEHERFAREVLAPINRMAHLEISEVQVRERIQREGATP